IAKVGLCVIHDTSVSISRYLLCLLRMDLEWTNAGQALDEAARHPRRPPANHILGSIRTESAPQFRHVSRGVLFSRIDLCLFIIPRSESWRHGGRDGCSSRT